MNHIAATIIGQTFRYDILTMDDIHTFLDVVRVNFSYPTHLFLTERGTKILSKNVMEQFRVEPQTDPQKETPLLKTFMGMHVVVLPGLSENILILGTLDLNC